jgi:hypothetical protein
VPSACTSRQTTKEEKPDVRWKVEPTKSELYEGKKLSTENTGKSWMPLEGRVLIPGDPTPRHNFTVGTMYVPIVGIERAKYEATDTAEEPQSAIERAAETLASAKRGKDATRLAKAARRIRGDAA